jgi:hypothetical protein
LAMNPDCPMASRHELPPTGCGYASGCGEDPNRSSPVMASSERLGLSPGPQAL